MEYSASSVKYLFWFVETRETARLLKNHSEEEVRRMVLEDNIYQQKDRKRIINECGCLIRRLQAVPEKLTDLLLHTDIATAKLIVLISAMATDRLMFELVYEVYRQKLHLGEEELNDSDMKVFFNRKAEQSEMIAGWTDATVKKLKQVYSKFLIEAGLLRKENSKVRRITKPYIDPELRQILLNESMSSYLHALTGEQNRHF